MGYCEWENGIAYKLVIAYLRDELELRESSEGTFQYKSVSVCVTPMPDRKFCNICLPRNHITLSGNDEDIKTFQHDFMMRFLSGGG